TVLQTVYYDRGHSLPDPGPLDLVRVHFDGDARPAGALPASWGVVAPIPVDSGTPVRKIVLSETMPVGQDPIFYINGEMWPFNNPVRASYGATEIWEIQNTADMDHPFHLHGMFFQVLDRD